jgi:hypothetical protein
LLPSGEISIELVDIMLEPLAEFFRGAGAVVKDAKPYLQGQDAEQLSRQLIVRAQSV